MSGCSLPTCFYPLVAGTDLITFSSSWHTGLSKVFCLYLFPFSPESHPHSLALETLCSINDHCHVLLCILVCRCACKMWTDILSRWLFHLLPFIGSFPSANKYEMSFLDLVCSLMANSHFFASLLFPQSNFSQTFVLTARLCAAKPSCTLPGLLVGTGPSPHLPLWHMVLPGSPAAFWVLLLAYWLLLCLQFCFLLILSTPLVMASRLSLRPSVFLLLHSLPSESPGFKHHLRVCLGYPIRSPSLLL